MQREYRLIADPRHEPKNFFFAMSYSTPGTCSSCLQHVETASFSQKGRIARWRAAFCTNDEVYIDNEPYVDVVDVDGQQGTLSDSRETTGADCVVLNFMKLSNYGSNAFPVQRVARFCSGTSLAALKKRHLQGRLSKVALVDVRKLQHGRCTLEKQYGPLTAYGLEEVLRCSVSLLQVPFQISFFTKH
jgi:hypothetical protein